MTAPDEENVPSALAFTSRPPRVTALDGLEMREVGCVHGLVVWVRPGAPTPNCVACDFVVGRARPAIGKGKLVKKSPRPKGPRGISEKFADALRSRWTDDA